MFDRKAYRIEIWTGAVREAENKVRNSIACASAQVATESIEAYVQRIQQHTADCLQRYQAALEELRLAKESTE